MKTIYGALVFIAVTLSTPGHATDTMTYQQLPAAPCVRQLSPQPVCPAYKTDPLFTLMDIFIYRPGGLAVTLVGAGLFVGLSPITALASIPEPHDAFYQAYKLLIASPGGYTFVRPIGDRSFPYIYRRSKP